MWKRKEISLCHQRKKRQKQRSKTIMVYQKKIHPLSLSPFSLSLNLNPKIISPSPLPMASIPTILTTIFLFFFSDQQFPSKSTQTETVLTVGSTSDGYPRVSILIYYQTVLNTLSSMISALTSQTTALAKRLMPSPTVGSAPTQWCSSSSSIIECLDILVVIGGADQSEKKKKKWKGRQQY